MAPPRWRIRLGAEAEQDFVGILTRTRDTFGPAQLDIYAATLRAALTALEEGPEVLGSVARDEIQPGLRTLHVARGKRRGRHFIMYRAADGVIEVVRILYDGMDLARHAPEKARDEG
jgi:toxin ParE1/3/4